MRGKDWKGKIIWKGIVFSQEKGRVCDLHETKEEKQCQMLGHMFLLFYCTSLADIMYLSFLSAYVILILLATSDSRATGKIKQ